MSTNREQVLELYTAMFNRAADIDGLNYWIGEMENNGWSILDVASSFAQQTEYTETYSSGDNTTFITNIYTNLLGREPDQEGLDYWVGELDSGNVQTAFAVTAIINGSKANTSDQGVQDAQFISNKSEVSDYFANTLGLNDLDQAKSIMEGVDATANSVALAKLSLNSFVATQYGASTADTHNGHTYLVFNEGKTFDEAKQAAEAVTTGSSLAIIDNAEENQFLYELLDKAHATTTAQDGGGASYAWIGASDVAQEGTWQWVDGQTMSYTNWGSKDGAQEPDNFDNSHLGGNYTGQQDYAALALTDWPVGSAGQWNDVDGVNILAYIVEIA